MTESEQKKQIAAQIWLAYFNRTLFERGVISEAERNKISLRIENGKSPAGFKK